MNDLEAIFAGAQRSPEPTGSPFLSFELRAEASLDFARRITRGKPAGTRRFW